MCVYRTFFARNAFSFFQCYQERAYMIREKGPRRQENNERNKEDLWVLL